MLMTGSGRIDAQRAFTRLGWGWGGDYAEPDYQHFSQPGT